MSFAGVSGWRAVASGLFHPILQDLGQFGHSDWSKKGKLRALVGLDFCRICVDLAILIGSDEAFCRICLTGTPANPANTFVRSV